MYDLFKTTDVADRLEEIAIRAYGQGGADHLRLAFDALVAVHQIRKETQQKPKPEQSKVNK